MTLAKSEPRCSGIYAIGKIDACPDRDRCMRYLSFIKLDGEAGLENYQEMTVFMAVNNCKIFMEAK